ncbi:hypothetical protein ABZP36_014639 [Zizania latifolia]
MAAAAASSSTAAATVTAASVSGTKGGGSVFPGPPPPTPSNHHPLPSSAAAGGTDAALSMLLQRLLMSSPAPTLRSPLSSRSRNSKSLPPLVSLDSPGLRPLRAAADVGYFHLEGHGVPFLWPSSALAELSLVDASARRVSNLVTLGFSEEEPEADGAEDPALVFDVDDEGEMEALPATAEFARQMRDVGMKVVAMMSGCPESGFAEEPFSEGRREARCLMWVSKVAAGEAAPPVAGKAKAYPYVVGLHCQWEVSGQEAAPAPASWVMDDGGEWTAVGARDGALLVTIGDIAQVWSNGTLRKVRGMARPVSAPGEGHGEADRLSVTVLISLPLDSVITPLVPVPGGGEEGGDDDDEADGVGSDGDGWRFRSFLLEDHAWRVYHERLQCKDPMVRYRI